MGRRAAITPESARMLYCMMGPEQRSIRRLQQELEDEGLKVAIHTLENWSIKFDWVTRAFEWDDERSLRREALVLDHVEEMENRHVRLGLKMQSLASQALELLADAFEQKHGDLPARDAIRMADTGIKLERQARGMDSQDRKVISYNIIISPIMDLFEEMMRTLDGPVRQQMVRQFAEGVDMIGDRLLLASGEEEPPAPTGK